MCGIAGFVISDKDFGKIDTERMTLVLARMMEQRGKDATGICTVSLRGRIELRKDALKAEVFLAGRKGIGRSAQTALIHTRAATQGSPSNPLNNHPIRYENIIGIHNGMVRNDDDLFDVMKWERKAQVDSEAIFASIHHYPKLHDGLEAIDAGWAIAWIDQAIEPRTLWLARGRSNPLFYGRTVEGSTVFASTKEAVASAFIAGGIITNAKDVYIYEAPQGFVACIDVAGELEEFPKFDFMGLNAVEDPTKRRTYHYGGFGTDDWVQASLNYRGGGGVTGKVTPPNGSSPPNSAGSGVGGGGNPLAPKEGDLRSRHVVGDGWVQQRFSAGSWHKQRPLQAREINAIPPADRAVIVKSDVVERTPTVVEMKQPYAITAGNTAGRRQIGDRIEIGVRLAVGSGDTFDITGTVIAVTESGDMMVDVDPCRIPMKVPNRLTGQLAQTGA